MTTFPSDMIINAILALLKESIEGPARPEETWVVSNEADSGVLGTLRNVSADEASRAPHPGGRTIAAHAEHVRFGLEATRRWLTEPNPQVNWSNSWNVSEVDEPRWRQLRDAIHADYEAAVSAIRAYDRWDSLSLTGAMGAAAHVTYHLGAIRQMIRQVRAAKS